MQFYHGKDHYYVIYGKLDHIWSFRYNILKKIVLLAEILLQIGVFMTFTNFLSVRGRNRKSEFSFHVIWFSVRILSEFI